jgi:hypothetical protein
VVLLLGRERTWARGHLLERGQVMRMLLGWRDWTWGLMDIWTMDLLVVLMLLWVRMKARSVLKLGREEGLVVGGKGHVRVIEAGMVVDRGYLRILAWVLHLQRVMCLLSERRYEGRRRGRGMAVKLAVEHRRRGQHLRRCRSILVWITPENIVSNSRARFPMRAIHTHSLCIRIDAEVGKRGLLFVVVCVDDEGCWVWLASATALLLLLNNKTRMEKASLGGLCLAIQPHEHLALWPTAAPALRFSSTQILALTRCVRSLSSGQALQKD